MTQNKALSIIGIGLGMIVSGMLFSIINILLPTIKLDLHASLLEMQWVMNVFGIVVCSTVVIFGRLADIFGRKRIFLMGLSFLIIAFIGDMCATTPLTIILLQILTGMSNAIMLSASQAMLCNEFPEYLRGKAIGIWAAIIGISLAIGPIVGSFMITFLSWRGVFGILSFVALFAIILIIRYSKETRNLTDPPTLDWAGMIALIIFIGSLVLAIVQYHTWPLHWIIGFGILSVIALINLIKIEKRAAMPIIHPRLINNRLFLLCSLNSALLIFVVWSNFFLIPMLLQTVAHIAITTIGWLFCLYSIFLVILSPWIGKKSSPQSAWRWTILGFICATLSVWFWLIIAHHFAMISVVISMALFGLSWAFIWGPTTTLAISSLPLQQAGIASGSYATFQEIGGTVGVAITGMIARGQPHLIHGFEDAQVVLLILMIIGIGTTLVLRLIGTRLA